MLKIKEFRVRHAKGQDFADEFSRWVGEERIPRAEDVRELPVILKKVKAKHLFENYDPPQEAFAKAKREIDVVQPEKNSKFFAQLVKVITLGKQASLDDLNSAASNEAARDLVIEAYQVIGSFMERAGVRVPGTPARRAAA